MPNATPTTERLRRAIFARLPVPALALGVVSAALSLTPSLLPRTWDLQGLLAGLSMSAGYASALLLRVVWHWLGLPSPAPHAARWWRAAWFIAWLAPASALLAFCLLRSPIWQNDVRRLMAMPPLDEWYRWRVAGIAVLVFAFFLALARGFRALQHLLAHPLRERLPQPLARNVAFLGAAGLCWVLANGVLLRVALQAIDGTYRELDQWVEDDAQAPAMEALGRHGQRFVRERSDAASIRTTTGQEAKDPLRIYVGLAAADSIGARVDLALRALMQEGAFDRRVLLITTPTGSGWVDPPAVAALEHLLHGDVATVAVQYSYLPSWLSLLSESAYGAETADALFRRVHTHWETLPADRRPRLVVHGVSLGALNSELAFNLYDLLDAPIDAALWVGPPFRSRAWRTLVENRDAGSSAWLPVYRGGRTVRFANQFHRASDEKTPWNGTRILYLQYASDPVSFFDPSILWRPPAWLQSPRGHDVTPRLRWYPLVTAFQLAADFAVADKLPRGFGHMYAVQDYVHAWAALLEPPGWTPAALDQLSAHLSRSPCCLEP
jgi:uncharacterized membrane protein